MATAATRPPAACPVSGSEGRCWRAAHQTTPASATSEIATLSRMVRRCRVIGLSVTPGRLDRHAPQREPALQFGLDRQFPCDLRLELQLALDRALLLAGRGHEGVPGPALVVVDEVDGLSLNVLEGEDGGQQPVAVAAGLQRLRDGVDADGEVLDVVVAQDHPAVAVVVVARLE